MFEFIKRVFKREEVKRIPGVTYAEVSRVPIKRVEVKKFEPMKFEPRDWKVEREKIKAEAAETTMFWRYQYTDTGEIVEKPAIDACEEILNSNRPVVVLKHFVK